MVIYVIAGNAEAALKYVDFLKKQGKLGWARGHRAATHEIDSFLKKGGKILSKFSVIISGETVEATEIDVPIA